MSTAESSRRVEACIREIKLAGKASINRELIYKTCEKYNLSPHFVMTVGEFGDKRYFRN